MSATDPVFSISPEFLSCDPEEVGTLLYSKCSPDERIMLDTIEAMDSPGEDAYGYVCDLYVKHGFWLIDTSLQMRPIDKNVPIPDRIHRPRQFKYPFKDMEVTDSFWVPKPISNMSQVKHLAQKEFGHKYITRTQVIGAEAGTRIWRVE